MVGKLDGNKSELKSADYTKKLENLEEQPQGNITEEGLLSLLDLPDTTELKKII